VNLGFAPAPHDLGAAGAGGGCMDCSALASCSRWSLPLQGLKGMRLRVSLSLMTRASVFSETQGPMGCDLPRTGMP